MKKLFLSTLVVMALVPVSCSSGATTSGAGDPSPTPSSAIVKAGGYLVSAYVAPAGDCRKVKDPDYGTGIDKNTTDAFMAGIVKGLALPIIENAEGQTVTVRDGSGDTIATATSAASARLLLAEMGDENDKCFALAEYRMQLPPAEDYLFSIEGHVGAPEPVSREELAALGYQCDLHLDRNGDIIESAGCQDVGLDVTL